MFGVKYALDICIPLINTTTTTEQPFISYSEFNFTLWKIKLFFLFFFVTEDQYEHSDSAQYHKGVNSGQGKVQICATSTQKQSLSNHTGHKIGSTGPTSTEYNNNSKFVNNKNTDTDNGSVGDDIDRTRQPITDSLVEDRRSGGDRCVDSVHSSSSNSGRGRTKSANGKSTFFRRRRQQPSLVNNSVWQQTLNATTAAMSTAAAPTMGTEVGATNGTTIGNKPGTVPAPPKRPVRRSGKPQPERPTRALFCLGLKNPIRKLCITVIEWKYPF